MYTFNAPPESFGLFYTHVYPKLSLKDAGGILRKYNNKDVLSKDPLKTGYIHLINNKQPA